MRSERTRATVAVRAGFEPPLGGDTPMDAALFRDRYLDDFEQSLKEALGRAPEQDRAVLRLHMVNNVSVEKIGKMLGVAQSTASRWLAKARENVLADLKSTLQQRLGIASAEIAVSGRPAGQSAGPLDVAAAEDQVAGSADAARLNLRMTCRAPAPLRTERATPEPLAKPTARETHMKNTKTKRRLKIRSNVKAGGLSTSNHSRTVLS